MTEYSSMNQFYYNSIINNNESARDDGTGNVWDDGVSVGNYWGDIQSSEPYSINGTSTSVDRWPIILVTSERDTTSDQDTTSTTTPTYTTIEPSTLAVIGSGVVITAIVISVVMLKRKR